ncbi:hypothetical protein ABEB36_003654 [Hypothenemus hampei]|uniref:Uncharacterized protein n=1 Tax=Hypothenemus hampei TaxID=57062 RepID=A0ABD1FD24_HYPHA
MKKDSSTRKNFQYLSEKQRNIEETWSRIRTNNTKLLQMKTEETKKALYYSTGYFNQMQEVYDEAMERITEYIKTAQQKAMKSTEETTPNEPKHPLSTLIEEQQLRMDEIEELIQESEYTEDNIAIKGIKTTILREWETIQTNHWKILQQDINKTSSYFNKQQYRSIRTKIFKIQGEADNGTPMAKPNQVSQNISLPKLQIPTFTGKYEE